MAVDKPWVVYDEWRKTYCKSLIIIVDSPQIVTKDISGDMIYLNVFGLHFVILNSLEVITDLFEKRSSNYSDRKQMTMFCELYVITSLSPQRTCQNCCWMQNECQWKISMAVIAIRPVVAKTQEIISRAFPPWRGGNLSKDKSLEHFYVDSLSHPMTCFTTSDSKHRVCNLCQWMCHGSNKL